MRVQWSVHFKQPTGFFLPFSFPTILSGLLPSVLKDLVRPFTVQPLEEPAGHVLATRQEKATHFRGIRILRSYNFTFLPTKTVPWSFLDVAMELWWYFSLPFVGSIHTHHPKRTHLIVLFTKDVSEGRISSDLVLA